MLYLVFDKEDELLYRTRSFDSLKRNLMLYCNVGIEKKMLEENRIVDFGFIKVEAEEL